MARLRSPLPAQYSAFRASGNSLNKKDFHGRFDLVLAAGFRARQLSGGAEPLLERDRDKNPVVALREIAAKSLKPEEVKEEYIRSLQKHAEVDEPEETRPEADDREDPSHRQVTEEELLRALRLHGRNNR